MNTNDDDYSQVTYSTDSGMLATILLLLRD